MTSSGQKLITKRVSVKQTLKTIIMTSIYESEDRLKDMIRSIYVYNCGTVSPDDDYLKPYREAMDEHVFAITFVNHMTHLKTFKIVHGVYTDHEGCTYNSLEPK